jgi:hypothetical protein
VVYCPATPRTSIGSVGRHGPLVPVALAEGPWSLSVARALGRPHAQGGDVPAGCAGRTSWATNVGLDNDNGKRRRLPPWLVGARVVAGVGVDRLAREGTIPPTFRRSTLVSLRLTLRSLFREQLHGMILWNRPPNPSRTAFAGGEALGVPATRTRGVLVRCMRSSVLGMDSKLGLASSPISNFEHSIQLSARSCRPQLVGTTVASQNLMEALRGMTAGSCEPTD